MANDDLDKFINETTSQRTLAPVAVASQVALMFGVSVSTRTVPMTAVVDIGVVVVCNDHRVQRTTAEKQGVWSSPLHALLQELFTCWNSLVGPLCAAMRAP